MSNRAYAQRVDGLQNVGELIAGTIEEMILRGELKPGARLVQTDIADRFGVSRFPVRDAFQLLLKKELVVDRPRRGIMVRPASLQEAHELFELRFLIESHAYGQSLAALTPEDVTALEAIIVEQEREDSSDIVALMEIDERFHERLLRHCPNREIRRTLVHIWNRLRIFRAYVGDVLAWRERSIEGHRHALEAIRRDDHEQARTRLEENMIRSRDEICRNLEATTAG